MPRSDAWFERLYKILQERVRRLVPRAEEGGGGASLTHEPIHDPVFGTFDEMLAADRRRPGDRLDFLEVRFDMAVMVG